MSRKECIFLTFLVLIASFLRLYRFTDFLEFLDDQGRDAVIIKKILVDHDVTLLGPRTSIGQMYLGPLYYYAMVPFLALTYPSPIGPALGVTAMGILSVALTYILGKNMVGQNAAGIAALLFAFSPAAIKLSRFSWQPNPAPLVGLLMIWFSFFALKKNKPKYWILVALCFTILSQLHYLALLSAVPAGILFLAHLWQNRKNTKIYRSFFSAFLLSITIFLLSLIPLVLFNMKHDNLILNGFQDFLVSQSQLRTPIAQKINQMVQDSEGVGMRLTVELIGFSLNTRDMNSILLVCLYLLSVFVLILNRSKHALGYRIVFLWTMIGIIGISYYQYTIYEHYFAFLFPALFLFVAVSLTYLTQKFRFLWVPIVVFLSVLFLKNVIMLPYWRAAPTGIHDLKNVSEKIQPYLLEGEKYNIALLNDNREYMGMKYRYFFEIADQKPQSQYNYTNLDKLVVIVENNEDPMKAPIYEIQQFVRESAGAPALLQRLEYKDSADIYIYEKK